MILEVATLVFLGWVVLNIQSPTQNPDIYLGDIELEGFNINNPIVKYSIEQRPELPGTKSLHEIRVGVAQQEADLTPLQQLFQRNQPKILPGVTLSQDYCPLIPMMHPKTPYLVGPSGEKMYNTAGWLN
jgi:hypothetical protein